MIQDNVKFNMPFNNMLEGEYTIQLFDKDNNLVDETTAHNCINKGLFATAYNNFIYQGLINNTTKYSKLNGAIESGDSGLANWLILTNSDETESNDSNNAFVIGDITGCAKTEDTKVYSDSRRGIANVNETKKHHNFEGMFLRSSEKEYVYDFGTDKANGSFDNLYLVAIASQTSSGIPNLGYYKTDSSITLNVKNIENPYTADSGFISHDEDNLYMHNLFLANPSNNSSTPKSYDSITVINKKTGKLTEITLQVPDSNVNNQAVIVQGGGLFWRIESTYKCTRYNLDGTYVDTISINSFWTGSYYYYGMNNSTIARISNNKFSTRDINVITGDEKYIYIGHVSNKVNNNNKYSIYLHILDKDLNEIAKKLIGESSNHASGASYFAFNIIYINNKKHLIYTSYDTSDIKLFEIEDSNIIEKSAECINNLASDLRGGALNYCFIDKDGIMYCQYRYDSSISKNLSIGRMIPWSSHVKLEKPITKTQDNTMKIKYKIKADFLYLNDTLWDVEKSLVTEG